ncbi:outer-membrane lipoprotein carrier protein LolA [Tundrisphaera lichenicola]|uniref:outer-membrane lipoprotein carrier protein LolA n=1 Tax=Tundrisphaera lichenicola TaxID=2029860 RepID=UPI003EBCE2FA
MRTLIISTITLAIGSWVAGTATGQAVAPAPNQSTAPVPAPVDNQVVKAQQAEDDPAQKALQAQRDLNALLVNWENQSKKITSLDVVFDRIDKLGPAWRDDYYRGQALLQSPDLACLEFKKYVVDAEGKPVQPLKLEAHPEERIVCTGTDVLQYQYDEKVVYVFPLDKQVRQKALQQGPLPFLFNMKASEVKARYRLVLMGQDAKEYLIEIKPKEEIDQQSFKTAYLWLDKKRFFPNKLRLIPVGEKEEQNFIIGRVKANEKIDPALFAAARFAGWKVINNPGGDGQKAQSPAPKAGATPGRAAQGQAQPAQRVRQPAMRPGIAPR